MGMGIWTTNLLFIKIINEFVWMAFTFRFNGGFFIICQWFDMKAEIILNSF